MTDTKHTPGPWEVKETPRHVGGYDIVGPEFGIFFCTFATDIDRESKSKRMADAHLIAAAPDLLDALENLVSAAQRALDLAETNRINNFESKRSEACWKTFNEQNSAVMSAIDAIAKARGL